MNPPLITALVLISFVLGDSVLTAADPPSSAVTILFELHCMECHRDESPKGNVSLEPLLHGQRDVALWQNVLAKIETGEMPPKPKPGLTVEERQIASDWLFTLVSAEKQMQRNIEGRVVLRRLNRVEYENTLRDLLGVSVRVRELLPQDASSAGFDNVGEALHSSSFLLARYLEAGEAALEQAIANGTQPRVKREHVTLEAAYQVKQNSENVFRKGDGGRITMFSSSPWQAATMFWIEQRGRYRFRLSVQADQSNGRPVVFSTHIGGGGGGPQPELVGYFDAPADAPKVIEFESFMEPRMSMTIRPYGLAPSSEIAKAGPQAWAGPGLAVDWIEMEGPLNDVWPPESHHRIFGGLKQIAVKLPSGNEMLEVQSNDAVTDTKRIIEGFARNAFRRPISEDELAPFIAMVEKRRAAGSSFEQAVRAGLVAVMTSPQFLFLRETPGRLDDFAIASRLSYFFWSSTPDEDLLTLAEKGQLHDQATLHAQVDRLLQSPKSAAFTEHFTGQWLRLREIDFTEPSMQLYPEFDDMLKVSMLREVRLFFDELLLKDLPLTNFLASDFSMLNGRLAKHYGIAGVDGWTFQRVKLPPDSHRGGVLTMAAILKITANGTNTSPVIRGAYVLDRIMGMPPKPPPPDAGSIEPDTRGSTTIRQQLARHRQIESCGSCHIKIDPLGFSLENFDVIGGWREYYRSTGNGKPVEIDGKKMRWLQGPAIDAGDVMADGRKIGNVDELKQILLDDSDVFGRALTIRLLTYGTGGQVEAVDQREVTAILNQAKARKWGFRSLLHEIVTSPLFLEK